MAPLYSVTAIPTIGIAYSHIGSSSRILGIASSQDAFNYRPSS